MTSFRFLFIHRWNGELWTKIRIAHAVPLCKSMNHLQGEPFRRCKQQIYDHENCALCLHRCRLRLRRRPSHCRCRYRTNKVYMCDCQWEHFASSYLLNSALPVCQNGNSTLYSSCFAHNFHNTLSSLFLLSLSLSRVHLFPFFRSFARFACLLLNNTIARAYTHRHTIGL